MNDCWTRCQDYFIKYPEEQIIVFPITTWTFNILWNESIKFIFSKINANGIIYFFFQIFQQKKKLIINRVSIISPTELLANGMLITFGLFSNAETMLSYRTCDHLKGPYPWSPRSKIFLTTQPTAAYYSIQTNCVQDRYTSFSKNTIVRSRSDKHTIYRDIRNIYNIVHRWACITIIIT